MSTKVASTVRCPWSEQSWKRCGASVVPPCVDTIPCSRNKMIGGCEMVFDAEDGRTPYAKGGRATGRNLLDNKVFLLH